MNRTPPAFGALLLAAAVLPVSAQAQIRVIPQVGLYVSVSDLGTVDTPEGVLEVGEQKSALALGLTLDLASAGTLGFRVTGLYGSDSEVPVGGIGCDGSACDLRSTMLGVSASAVLRLLPAGSPFRPYLSAGGGIKRYDFEFDTDSQLNDAFGDESQATVVVGLGFDWSLGFLKGNLELADYMSDSFLDDGDRQHDFFLTAGLILG